MQSWFPAKRLCEIVHPVTHQFIGRQYLVTRSVLYSHVLVLGYLAAGLDDMNHKVISQRKFLQQNPFVVRSFSQANTTRCTT
jgi:hypothetical protein